MLIQTALLISFREIQVLQQQSLFEGCLTVVIGISLLCCWLLLFACFSCILSHPLLTLMTLMFLTCVTVPSPQHHPAALAFVILDDHFLDSWRVRCRKQVWRTESRPELSLVQLQSVKLRSQFQNKSGAWVHSKCEAQAWGSKKPYQRNPDNMIYHGNGQNQASIFPLLLNGAQNINDHKKNPKENQYCGSRS